HPDRLVSDRRIAGMRDAEPRNVLPAGSGADRCEQWTAGVPEEKFHRAGIAHLYQLFEFSAGRGRPNGGRYGILAGWEVFHRWQAGCALDGGPDKPHRAADERRLEEIYLDPFRICRTGTDRRRGRTLWRAWRCRESALRTG